MWTERSRDRGPVLIVDDEATIAVHMRGLRAKIEDDPADPRHVKMVWGAGYRFEP